MYTKARAYLYKQTLLPNHPYNSLKNTYVSIEKHSTGERFFFLALFEEEAFLTFFFSNFARNHSTNTTRARRARGATQTGTDAFSKSGLLLFLLLSFRFRATR